MKVVKGIALTLMALIASGIAASFIAIGMADNGLLGSCFEGRCGYAAIYAAFPLTWIILFAGSVIGYLAWSRRNP